MTEPLALKYRPRAFTDLVGQRHVQVILGQMITRRDVPPAMLFTGARGTGKTTSARVLAAALNCENLPGPCGNCVPCKAVFDGTSLDVIEIDAASNGLVDDIRELRQQLLYRMAGDYRIVILDEAHSASQSAFNAMLKTIEEPPPGARFILCTTEHRRIPDTILSRAMPFHFRKIAPADIAARLAHIATTEGIPAERDMLDAIAARANGGLRDAIMLLDQVSRAGAVTAADLSILLGTTSHADGILCALIDGDLAAAYQALDHAMHTTGDASAIFADLIHQLRTILDGTSTYSITIYQAVAAMKIIWDLKIKSRVTDDPRSNLELAIIMIADTLRPIAPPAPDPIPAARLSLSQMAAQR